MPETLSVEIDQETSRKLDELASETHRSKSQLAADAIASFLDADEWQRAEIEAAIGELDTGQGIDHTRVAEWLSSWGTADELPPPK